MGHNQLADYTCPTCKETIWAGIPHECNFFICHRCNGSGKKGWRSTEECSECHGTGRWVNVGEME